ncbi:hypothetical protein J3F83DRAFT_683434 [Trichoderma novae-zelandiae]
MRSGRVPTLGEQVADGYMAYFIPERTRRVPQRPRIPEIAVASPSGEVRPVVDISQLCFDGPLEEERREMLRESLAKLEKLREKEAAIARSVDQTCLVDQTKEPAGDKPAENEKSPEEEKPLEEEKAPKRTEAPEEKAPQASSGSICTKTFRAILAFGRHFVSSRRTNSRGWRKSLMG